MATTLPIGVTYEVESKHENLLDGDNICRSISMRAKNWPTKVSYYPYVNITNVDVETFDSVKPGDEFSIQLVKKHLHESVQWVTCDIYSHAHLLSKNCVNPNEA